MCRCSREGFETTTELLEVSAVELAKELNIPRTEALEILECVRNCNGNVAAAAGGGGAASVGGGAVAASTATVAGTPALAASAGKQEPPRTALDVLEEEQQRSSLTTLCAEWDGMLGGGVPLTKITEFCGAPGIGKTQLGMQLAMNVQIPTEFGGNGGEAVYIVRFFLENCL